MDLKNSVPLNKVKFPPGSAFAAPGISFWFSSNFLIFPKQKGNHFLVALARSTLFTWFYKIDYHAAVHTWLSVPVFGGSKKSSSDFYLVTRFW